jgi:hypothetical protein
MIHLEHALLAFSDLFKRLKVADWQPMDTAPKDGRRIIVFRRMDYRQKGGRLVEDYEIVHWGESLCDDHPCWTEPRDGQEVSGILCWMPLPALPEYAELPQSNVEFPG